MGFSTDQYWFCIRDCQVQIYDGTTDTSIESFCVFLTFSWQMLRHFLMRTVNNCVTLTSPYRLSYGLLCMCAFLNSTMMLRTVHWLEYFYHISIRRFGNWRFSLLLLVACHNKSFCIVCITGSNIILFFSCRIHPLMVHHITNWWTCNRQPQQLLSVPSLRFFPSATLTPGSFVASSFVSLLSCPCHLLMSKLSRTL